MSSGSMNYRKSVREDKKKSKLVMKLCRQDSAQGLLGTFYIPGSEQGAEDKTQSLFPRVHEIIQHRHGGAWREQSVLVLARSIASQVNWDPTLSCCDTCHLLFSNCTKLFLSSDPKRMLQKQLIKIWAVLFLRTRGPYHLLSSIIRYLGQL